MTTGSNILNRQRRRDVPSWSEWLHTDHGLGLFFIFVVAIIWVSASFVTQDLVVGGMPPFILTYVANSLFIIYLPLHMLHQWWTTGAGAFDYLIYGDEDDAGRRQSDAARLLQRLQDSSPSREEGSPSGRVEMGRVSGAGTSSGGSGGGANGVDTLVRLAGPRPPKVRNFYGWSPTFRAALSVCPLWFLAQFSFNVSLGFTSVTSNTILSSTASLYTFGLAVAMGNDKFTNAKFTSILLSLLGVVLVTVSDTGGSKGSSGAPPAPPGVPPDPSAHRSGMVRGLEGDALCLMSAMTYAAYTVVLKAKLPDDHHASMTRFFGLMGTLTLVVGGVIVLLGTAIGAISLEGVTARAVGLTIMKGLMSNVIADYLWARAVLLVGPTLATVGLALQVPLAVFMDALIPAMKLSSWNIPPRGKSPWMQFLSLVGATAVLAGFFGVNSSEEAAAPAEA